MKNEGPSPYPPNSVILPNSFVSTSAVTLAALFSERTHLMDSPTVPNFPTYPAPPPSSPPNIWQRFTSWFRGQARRVQITIAVIALLGTCALCGTITDALFPNSSTTGATTAAHTSSTTGSSKPTATTAKPGPTATTKVNPTATTPSKPNPTATKPPPPRYPAIGGNPYDYTLTNTGHILYQPAADVCTWLKCIPSFWQHTNGYVDLCNDGYYSHSGGVTGACSKHGNERQPVYQP